MAIDRSTRQPDMREAINNGGKTVEEYVRPDGKPSRRYPTRPVEEEQPVVEQDVEEQAPKAKSDQYQWNRGFRAKIIACAFVPGWYEQYGPTVFRPEFFETDEEQAIIEFIPHYYKRYKRAPEYEDLKTVADDIKADNPLIAKCAAELIESVEDWLEKGEENDYADLEYAREMAVQFAKEQAMKIAILESVPDIEKGRLSNIPKRVAEALKVGQVPEPWLSLKDVMEFDFLAAVNWIVVDLIEAGNVVPITGESGLGKTWLALDAALAIAAGQKCLGDKYETQQAHVFWVDQENRKTRMMRRIMAISRRRKINWEEVEPYFHFRTMPDPPFHADNAEQVEKFAAEVNQFEGPKICFFDNLGSISSSKIDMNSDKMREVISGLMMIASKTGAAVVPIHHPNKQDRTSMYGSGYIKNYVDNALLIEGMEGENYPGEDDKKLKYPENTIRIKGSKQRDMRVDVLVLELVIEGEDKDTRIPINPHFVEYAYDDSMLRKTRRILKPTKAEMDADKAAAESELLAKEKLLKWLMENPKSYEQLTNPTALFNQLDAIGLLTTSSAKKNYYTLVKEEWLRVTSNENEPLQFETGRKVPQDVLDKLGL